MKIIVSILLTLSFTAALAVAQPKYTAFSMSNIAQTKDNLYLAEKNTVDTHGEATVGDKVSHYILIQTEGCKHVPGKDATAIYLDAPNGVSTILFSDGPSCKVVAAWSSNTNNGGNLPVK